MSDPLDALTRPPVPAEPRPAFSAELRRLLARQLGHPERQPTMATATATTDSPSRLAKVTSYLCVHDTRAAIAFYKAAFDATEMSEPIVMADGRVGHAEIEIGGSAVMLSDEFADLNVLSPRSRGGSTSAMVLSVPDVDATFAKALAAGATLDRPVEDQSHGARAGWLVDPFGQRWNVGTATEDVAGATEPEVPEMNPPDADTSTADPTRGQLFYFTLAVRDRDKARAFYTALLGWQLEDGPEGFHIANLDQPGGMFVTADAGPPTLYFKVADIDQGVEQVRRLGGTADEPVLYPSGWAASCHDDQGTAFTLSVPAPEYA